MVGGGAELPGVAAGDDAGAGGGAFGVGGVGAVEEEAFAGDAVEAGGFDPGTAVGAGSLRSKVTSKRTTSSFGQSSSRNNLP